MPKKLFKVVKWDGSTEFFQSEKLFSSLKRSGASDKIAQRIVDHVEGELEDGMKTDDIYRHAFEFLKKNDLGVAGRYDLKKAIMRLGPSGYPFETFVAGIFQHLGYRTEVGKIVQGSCIEHEVDVLAENDKEVVMMECKYHNYHDTSSDVKTALYVHARMEDLKKGWQKRHPNSKKSFRGCLMTNTKFSSSAEKYARCVGLNIISWSQPPGQSLRELIDRAGLHPITCLTTLTEGHIKTLLNDGKVLCRDIPEGLKGLKLSKEQREKILEEAQELCQLR
ncbi:MAG: restriction endonuclease [bacterium]|nr:restriction endonuclease [bacterium]